ncbi:MAG TPA: hypothetical protein PK720_03455, partial [bacterium]|nr:hypothetical protein [bacterium]
MAGKIAGAGLSSIGKTGKTLTGFNAVNDRVKAFNKQREAARSEKIGAFGDKAFGGYLKVKGGIAGTAQGLKETFKTGINKGLDNSGTFGEAVRAPLESFRNWKEDRGKRKKEERDIKDARKNAYINGVYKDPSSGKEYKEYKEGNNTYYRTERKDEAGEVIPNEYDYAETVDNKTNETKRIEKINDFSYNYNNAWTQAMINSRAYNNKREKGEADKEKDKLTNAGLTKAELLGVLEDVSAGDTKRLAASLALAVKEGFKNSGQVKMAQALLHSKNNNLLDKQFNDDVDKKQAHLNYDVETSEGRIKFAKRREEGKFDVLQADAYKNENVIRALKESMTDKEFVKHAEKVSAYSTKHDQAQKEGLVKHLDTLTSPVFDPVTGEIDKARKVVPKITRNLNDTIRGNIEAKEVPDALEGAFDSMSISDIAKLKPESLDSTIIDNPEKAAHYNNTINEIIMNLSKADIANIRRVQDGNRETVAEIYRRWYLTNPDKRKDMDPPSAGGSRRGSSSRQRASREGNTSGNAPPPRRNQPSGNSQQNQAESAPNTPPKDFTDASYEIINDETKQSTQDNSDQDSSNDPKQLGP